MSIDELNHERCEYELFISSIYVYMYMVATAVRNFKTESYCLQNNHTCMGA